MSEQFEGRAQGLGNWGMVPGDESSVNCGKDA